MNQRLLLIACVTAAVSVQAHAADKKQSAPLRPEQVKVLVQIKDDSLERFASFSTADVKKRKLFSSADAFGFLRAKLDKSNGEAGYHVYTVIEYERDWRFYERVNYSLGGDLKTDDLNKISRDVYSCRAWCSYSEHVSFFLTEEQAKTVANMPSGENFRYRLKSRAGVDTDVELEPSEFGGLLAAVEEYRAKLSAPK